MTTSQRLLILSETVVVVVVWICALVLPFRLVLQVQRTLPEVWRDPSLELQTLASMMSILLEIYVRRIFEDIFRGLGFPGGRVRSWSIFLQNAWQLIGIFDMAADMGSRWFRHQATSAMVESMIITRLVGQTELSLPDMKLPQYKYQRLSSSRAIRLMTLQPTDSRGGPISCSMEEVLLDIAPPFTALSYAWDSQDGTQQVVCNDALLTVTKNCVAALRSIRDDSTCKGKQVWVDAICIN